MLQKEKWRLTISTLVLLTETQFLSVKHRKSLLRFSEPGDLNTKRKHTHTHTHTQKQRLGDTFMKRKCLWQRSVILVRISVISTVLQYMFQAHNVKQRV